MNKNPLPFDPTRRSFMRQACCAAVGATGLLSALAQLRMIGAVAGDAARTTSGSSDYKALVCVFLYGGNDSNNVVVPYDTASYNIYSAARTALAYFTAVAWLLRPVISSPA